MKHLENYQRSVKAICEVMESNGFSTEIRTKEIHGTKGDEKISFSPYLLMDLCEEDLSYNEMLLRMSLIIEFMPVMDIERIKPYLITQKERDNLDENIYVETLEDGRNITYYDSLVRSTQPFVTKKEALLFPEIREKAYNNLEEVERFDYSITGIEDGKVLRIMDEHRHTEPRIALVTNNVFQILSENYQDHAYLVTTPRGDLFVFGIDEDPSQVVGELMESSIGLLSERFDVLSYHDKHINNHFTIINERKWL